VTIIIVRKKKFLSTSYQKKMKVLTIYLLSLVFFASAGQHIANNIKENLQQRTEKIDSVLSSYSVYLQNN
tara:strand:+ start:582 stop:791 length:210 start_codon:yes stop_codon:yes gene_type:complete